MADHEPEEPQFVAPLRRQLLEGVPAFRRRRRNRRLGAAVAGTAIVVAALAGVVVRSSDEDGSRTVIVDQPTTTVDPLVAAPSPLIASNVVATTLGGFGEKSVFSAGMGLLIVNPEDDGPDSAGPVPGPRVAGEIWEPVTNTVRPMAPSGLTWRGQPAMAWTGSEILMAGENPEVGPEAAAYVAETDEWRRLPDPPVPVAGPGFWTGSELVVSGSDLAFDPRTETWRRTAARPGRPRMSPVQVWTGDRLVVWGGCDSSDSAQCDDENSHLLGDGYVYDPSTDTWSAMAESPLTPAVHAEAVWTDTEVLVVVTEPGRDAAGATAAAYNPTTDSWRTLPDVPLSPRRYAAAARLGVWTVVWGGLSSSGNGAAELADGAVFDQRTGTWSTFSVDPARARQMAAMGSANGSFYVSDGRPDGPPFSILAPGAGPMLQGVLALSPDGLVLRPTSSVSFDDLPLPVDRIPVLDSSGLPIAPSDLAAGDRVRLTFDSCNEFDLTQCPVDAIQAIQLLP